MIGPKRRQRLRIAARITALLDAEYYEVLASDAWIESKLSAGGSASARVAEQMAAARAALAELAG